MATLKDRAHDFKINVLTGKDPVGIERAIDEVFPTLKGARKKDERKLWFLVAANCSPISVLMAIQRHDPKVIEPNELGQTALHRCKVGNVRTLVDMGIDINARTVDGLTPLIAICANKPEGHFVRADMIRELLACGADPMVVDNNGRTPLIEALLQASNTDYRAEAIGLLLAAGVDVHAKDKERCSALAYACGYGMSKCLPLLLDAGARFDRQSDLKAAVRMAVSNNEPHTLAALVEHGLNPSSSPDELLHLAFKNDAPGAALWLLEAGLDPLALNAKGKTVDSMHKNGSQCHAVLQSFLARRAAREAIASLSPKLAGGGTFNGIQR